MNGFFQSAPGASLIFLTTIAMSLLGLFGSFNIIEKALLRPYWLIRRSQYATLVSSGFVHADLQHLAFNMFTFYAFAFALERRIATTSFVTLYVAGLVLSNLGTFFKHRNDESYASLGASGAILAVLFASIVYFPRTEIYVFPLPVAIPAPVFAVLYLGYSFYQSRRSIDRINHDAHFSGALVGLAFVLIHDPASYLQMAKMFGW